MASLIQKIFRRLTLNDESALAILSQEDGRLVREIRRRKLTYLSPKKLASIVTTCRDIENQGLEGGFVEAGCALGGSAILIAKIKGPTRLLNVYDVFEMIPAPTDADGSDVKRRYEKIRSGKSRGIDGDRYYGYEDDLLAIVRGNLRSFDVQEGENGISLIKGLVQDTLNIDGPVAFAHIDVDWYEPVMTCLQRLIPQLAVGGSIILDDYQDWSGCRKATDEYFRDIAAAFDMDDSAGSMKITRIRS